MLESGRGISVPCGREKLATGALGFDVKGFMDGLGHGLVKPPVVFWNLGTNNG